MSSDRHFAGQRTLRIAARTVHLVAVAFVVGAALYGESAPGSGFALVASGAVMVTDDLWKYGADWLRYTQGWAVLLKVGLAVVAALSPPLAIPALVGAIVIGGVVSHAPGKVRQAAVWGPPGPCATRATGREA